MKTQVNPKATDADRAIVRRIWTAPVTRTGRFEIDLKHIPLPYEKVTFYQDHNDGEFTWIAKYDFNIMKMSGNAQSTQGFKTERGCKKNFMQKVGLLTAKY